jgi:hypothetical protein
MIFVRAFERGNVSDDFLANVARWHKFGGKFNGLFQNKRRRFFMRQFFIARESVRDVNAFARQRHIHQRN